MKSRCAPSMSVLSTPGQGLGGMMWVVAVMLAICSPLASYAVGWVARHNLTSAEYQDAFDSWKDQGLRLKGVNGYETPQGVRYAAIWDGESGPSQSAIHGVASTTVMERDDLVEVQGYRPRFVSVYPDGGQVRYAAIWEKTNDERIFRLGRSYATFVTEKAQMESAGWRIFHLSVTSVGGADVYAAIWQKGALPFQQVVVTRLSSAEYQAEFNTRTGQGYRPVMVYGHQVGLVERFAAIFRKEAGPSWFSHHTIAAVNYQTAVENYHYMGYRPVFAAGYEVNGSVQFNLVVENNGGWGVGTQNWISQQLSPYMQDNDTPGVSFAISRNGKLVYARGLGYADTASGAWAGPLHRYRIASISKPITATGVLRLVQQGKFGLDDKVFGSGALLGTQYGNGSYSTWEKEITVRHLLTHTTGWRSESPLWDNSYGENHKSIMDWTLDSTSPSFKPGTTYSYMNLDYHTLGRIIEKFSGQSYGEFIKQSVLAPCGVTKMELGGQSKAARLPREVTYYDFNGNDPYVDIHPRRMDANGGWVSSAIDLLQFLRRIDDETHPSDLLNQAMRDEMRNYALAGGYGLGWFPAGGGAEGHNGCMTGTSSFMVHRPSGVSYAVVANKRTGCSWELKAVMDTIVAKLEQDNNWPGYDLFPVPSSKFAQWIQVHAHLVSQDDFALESLGELLKPEFDSDRDGRSNLEEAYFGSDPYQADLKSPVTVFVEGKEVVYRWVRSTQDTGVTARLLWSSDLKNWGARRVQVETVGRPNLLAQTETVEVRVPWVKGSQLFLKFAFETE